jgi:hypothetical protein
MPLFPSEESISEIRYQTKKAEIPASKIVSTLSNLRKVRIK